MSELPEHVARNRRFWDEVAAEWVKPGREDWAAEPRWGIFRIPETEVGMLPDDLEGKEAIELGCGTAYVSSWLARRGARPTGIDNSEGQLATARSLQQEFGIEFPLLHGNAEEVPLPDRSFDLAISEYGASIWCDPYRWIPEAARLLRPGGELVFLVNSVFTMLCGPDDEAEPATERMIRPFRDAPLRVARRVGRIPPPPRRVDRPAAGERLRGRGTDRAAPARRRHHPLLPVQPGVGAALAGRGGLAGAARLGRGHLLRQLVTEEARLPFSNMTMKLPLPGSGWFINRPARY